jgi:hypothetical protein
MRAGALWVGECTLSDHEPGGSGLADRIPMTRQSYDKLREDVKRLKAEERPRIVKEIELARAHGDLSENAEFHAAKEKQGQIEGRIRQLEDRLARAQLIDPSDQSADQVRFGLTVDLEDADTGEKTRTPARRSPTRSWARRRPTRPRGGSPSPRPWPGRCWARGWATA